MPLLRPDPVAIVLSAAVAALIGACAHGGATVHLAPPDADAEIGASAVREVLGAHRARLTRCVASVPAGGGPTAVLLDFTVDEVGAVSAWHAPPSALGPEVDACFAAVVRPLRFVPPNDAAPVRVRELLHVVPAGEAATIAPR